MQASKIELHHKRYAIAMNRATVNRHHNTCPDLREDMLLSGRVVRIITDRHENGPKGMTQTVVVKITDLAIQGGREVELTGLDPAQVKGEEKEYRDLLERKEEASRQQAERSRAHHRKLGRVCLALKRAGMPDSGAKMMRNYGYRDAAPGTKNYNDARIVDGDLDHLLQVLERFNGRPTTDAEVEAFEKGQTQERV